SFDLRRERIDERGLRVPMPDVDHVNRTSTVAEAFFHRTEVCADAPLREVRCEGEDDDSIEAVRHDPSDRLPDIGMPVPHPHIASRAVAVLVQAFLQGFRLRGGDLKEGRFPSDAAIPFSELLDETIRRWPATANVPKE